MDFLLKGSQEGVYVQKVRKWEIKASMKQDDGSVTYVSYRTIVNRSVLFFSRTLVSGGREPELSASTDAKVRPICVPRAELHKC